MKFQNETKNQHYLSQIEQRFNAINPSAKHTHQKIYSYKLIDRESHAFKLENSGGLKIEKTLSLDHLFSFEVIKEKNIIYNFENLFNQYESTIKENTESLLKKTRMATGEDVKKEVLNLFLSKFLNFLRNPYSIHKVLNTFSQVKNIKPTSTHHLENFEKVLRKV